MPQALPNGAIRAASYSGVRVYETMCRGIPVMRRMGDAYINATQILRAAGLPKPQRTKILERDVTGGVHEKVQGGYAGFQGTWVPLGSARKIAAIHGVDRELDPLFSYIPQPGDEQTSTKDRRKRILQEAPNPPLGPSSSSAPTTPIAQIKEDTINPTPPSSSSAPTGIDTLLHASGILTGPASAALTEELSADKQHPSDASGPSDVVPSSSDGEHALGLSQDDEEASPERRTTTMALRPAGTRSKRRRNYPGEDDDEFRLSAPKQRRTATAQSSPAQRAATFEPLPSAIQQALLEQTTSTAYQPASSSTSTARPQHHAHFPPHLAVRHSSVASSRDRTPPHAGKRCETCGVTSTPQWRRGPSGKRTLCNACGVKWSFGRLNPNSGSAGAGSGAKSHTTGDEYDTMTDSDDMEHFTPDVSTQNIRRSPGTPTPTSTNRASNNSKGTVAEIQTEVKSLKRKLKESEKSRKRLRKIIDDTVNETATAQVDPRIRRVLANAQQQAEIVASGGEPSSSSTMTAVENLALAWPRYEPISIRAQRLAIAKQMIQAHNMHISMEYDPSSDEDEDESEAPGYVNYDVVDPKRGPEVDESDAEETAREEVVVLDFILKVKRRNEIWERDLRKLRVPHGQPGNRDPVPIMV